MTQEWDDFWVCQVFPHYGDLVEGLGIPSALENGKIVVLSTHLVGLLWASLGVQAHTLSPYVQIIEGLLIHRI